MKGGGEASSSDNSDKSMIASTLGLILAWTTEEGKIV